MGGCGRGDHGLGWDAPAVEASAAQQVAFDRRDRATDMTAITLIKDAAAVAIAGWVGTKAMEPVSMKLYELEPADVREREDQARPGPPFKLAARRMGELVGIDLDDNVEQTAGMAFHYGAGLSWVPVYMILRRRTGLGPIPAGLATGASMSLILDETITPLIGASAPNRDYPSVTHLRGAVAHLAYGLAVAATVETVWKLLRR